LENDRPSSTATLIAAATVYLAADPRFARLVPEGAAEVCARCLPPARRSAVCALSHPALRWAARLAERATVPGLLEHFMLRKRWIEAAVRAAPSAASIWSSSLPISLARACRMRWPAAATARARARSSSSKGCSCT